MTNQHLASYQLPDEDICKAAWPHNVYIGYPNLRAVADAATGHTAKVIRAEAKEAASGLVTVAERQVGNDGLVKTVLAAWDKFLRGSDG